MPQTTLDIIPWREIKKTKNTNAAMPAYRPNPVGRVPAIPNMSVSAFMPANFSYGLPEQMRELKEKFSNTLN